jgi:quinol monooxygenase YgiN
MPLRRGAEYGCESYEVSEDIEAPQTFVLVERSRDLDAHTSTSATRSSQN